MAVSVIPTLFGMAAGVLVDRADKRKIMIWMDVLRGISTSIIALLFTIDALQIWHLYAFAFFNSVCEVFSTPARSSAMQVLVKKEHYLASNSLSQASSAAAEILGMGIAAAIIGIWGIGIAVLIDAATFFVSAFTAVIAKITTVRENNGALNGAKFFQELFDGVRIIKSNILILINITMGCLVNILLAPFNVFMPVYADKILKSGEQGYSYMGMAIMVGTMLGAIIVGQLGHRFKRSTKIIGGFIVFGSSIGALGFVDSLIPAILLCTVTGVCLPVISATGMATVQEHTPKEKMGRVASTISTLALLGMPMGYAISGIVGESLNIQLTFVLLGALIVAICIPPLFSKEFRKS